MKRNKLFKVFLVCLIFAIMFSLAACSAKEEPVEPDEGATVIDQPGGQDSSQEGSSSEDGQGDIIHANLKLVHSEDELSGYVTEISLEELYDYYKAIPILINIAEFDALPDVFMFKTKLYDFVGEIGKYIGGTAEHKAWEQDFLSTYEEVEGLVVIVGVRGGSVMGLEIVPNNLAEYFPKSGTFVYIASMDQPPGGN